MNSTLVNLPCASIWARLSRLSVLTVLSLLAGRPAGVTGPTGRGVCSDSAAGVSGTDSD